jgi:hypothetical protein
MGMAAGRFGTPDDIKGLAVFLASDASSWITGAIIPMDGGNLAINGGGSVRPPQGFRDWESRIKHQGLGSGLKLPVPSPQLITSLAVFLSYYPKEGTDV